MLFHILKKYEKKIFVLKKFWVPLRAGALSHRLLSLSLNPALVVMKSTLEVGLQ